MVTTGNQPLEFATVASEYHRLCRAPEPPNRRTQTEIVKMDLKQIVMLAVQVSILSTVFGFGLNATRQDLLYLLRQPGLLVRSLLAVFVFLPIVVVGLALAFDFPQSVKIVLVALALSPVPPILPRKETGAGGDTSYALGLMAVLSIVSIVAVPLGLKFLQLVFGGEFGMPPGTIASVVVTGTILPLLAGMAVRSFLPALAARLGSSTRMEGTRHEPDRQPDPVRPGRGVGCLPERAARDRRGRAHRRRDGPDERHAGRDPGSVDGAEHERASPLVRRRPADRDRHHPATDRADDADDPHSWISRREKNRIIG